jgi:hypothetical protein
VEPHLAELLDDKVLDADLESGNVRFTLAEAGPGAVPPSG